MDVAIMVVVVAIPVGAVMVVAIVVGALDCGE
jgi:hypothetical protein